MTTTCAACIANCRPSAESTGLKRFQGWGRLACDKHPPRSLDDILAQERARVALAARQAA